MMSTLERDSVQVATRGATVAEFPAGATYGPVRLPDFEFVWLLRGEATWECGEHDRQSLRPGQLLLARPGLLSRFVWDPNGPTRHAYAHFRITHAASRLGPHADWPVTRPLIQPLNSLCDYLLWLAASDLPQTRQRMNDVLALLVTVFVRGPLPLAEPDQDELPIHVIQVAKHIQQVWTDSQRPMRPIKLNEMAAAAGVSPAHLSRIFHGCFGLGAVTAIERIRLDRAATLLSRSNLSIAAVANACGFANPYHFSRRFRMTYGRAPRHYRHHPSDYEPMSRHGLLTFARYIRSDLGRFGPDSTSLAVRDDLHNSEPDW